MRDPTAHLDHRFSHDDAVATPWSVTLVIIESAELYFLSTVRRDGRAHVTPLVGQ